VTKLNAQNPHVNILRNTSSDTSTLESFKNRYAELALTCDFILGDDHRSRFEFIVSSLVIMGAGVGAVKLSVISQNQVHTPLHAAA
jgi:hypothetical protein